MMSIFTFGREHEKKCAISHVGDEIKAKPLIEVIDAIHDLIEGKEAIESVKKIVKKTLSEGGSGIWESTGNWLLKLGKEYPLMQDIWYELADHSQYTVRFRVAAYLTDLPGEIREKLYLKLSKDKSKKVREHAIENWHLSKNENNT